MKTKVQITFGDFSTICRICLLPNDLLPIDSTDWLNIFKIITNIDITVNDGLPRNVCKICVQLLEKIGYFIEQSKNNYSTLLAIVQQESYEAEDVYSDGCGFKNESILNEDIEEYNSESGRKTVEINESGNFECAKCGLKFGLKKLLILHINEKHVKNKDTGNNDTKNCDISKDTNASNFTPIKHKNVHSRKVRKKNINCKYSCSVCDRTLTSQSALDNHMRTHTGARPYQCVYCDKAFAFSGSLTGHIRTHTGETPYTCTMCNKSYHSSSSLKKHKETQHFDIECSNEQKTKNYDLEDLEKVQCKFCNRMLNKHGYGTHMRIHTNEKKEFVCPFCSKHFKKMSHLDRHVRIHTGERPFVCKMCKKPFTQEGDLKRHWAVHSGQKKFQCQHCGKLYFTKGALETHITVHTGVKKSTNCNICKKPHKQCDEQSHSILQTEQRSFLCTICGKSFTASNSLKIHIRLHTGDCPFVCTYCGKAYTSTSNLKRHVMRNHTLEKPHVCMICNKAFHDSTNLKRHVNRVHSVLEIKDRKESGSNLKEAAVQ